MNDNPNEIVRRTKTVKELAQILRLSTNATYEAIKRGEIRGVIRIGRRLIVPDAVIDRMLSGHP